jgi:hypothetical protein
MQWYGVLKNEDFLGLQLDKPDINLNQVALIEYFLGKSRTSFGGLKRFEMRTMSAFLAAKPPIETWSSVPALVLRESTDAGWHNTLFSDTEIRIHAVHRPYWHQKAMDSSEKIQDEIYRGLYYSTIIMIRHYYYNCFLLSTFSQQTFISSPHHLPLQIKLRIHLHHHPCLLEVPTLFICLILIIMKCRGWGREIGCGICQNFSFANLNWQIFRVSRGDMMG